MKDYFTDVEIANLLGISLGRLRNKVAESAALPPRTQIPGHRKRLWPKKEVHLWIGSHLVFDGDSEGGDSCQKEGKKIGRPKKAKKISAIESAKVDDAYSD